MKTDVILKTIGCESYSGHIGNLFCEDENNNEGCYYDGGDCCGNFVYKDLCTECICYEYLECLGSIELIGNGFCNDETNSADCNYDGGDCCVNINTDVCSNCTCFHQENCLLGFTPSVVGDGLCHDETNNAACTYDGGDCCVNINTDDCSNCTCYHQENCLLGFTPSIVGDGLCHDETNNADCKFDGGDCCGGCVRKDNCSECVCYNEVASPNDLSCKFCIHTKVSLLGVDSLWGMFIPADWLS